MNKVIQNRQRFGSRLGLERIEAMCSALGNPERQYPVIHVAGTNGKGSTAAFLASILRHAGYRVGLFTSPHLTAYRERFQVNGCVIDEGSLDNVLQEAERTAVSVEDSKPGRGPVTEFEVCAAAGFLWFQAQRVDVAVVETGLGGRFDATNVVQPLLTLITPVGWDHMDWLGETLPAIAAEKAGIIKQGVPVAIGNQPPEVYPVLHATALSRQAPFFALQSSSWVPESWDASGGQFSFSALDGRPFSITLLGGHQLENAGLALLAVEILSRQGWVITPDQIRRGLVETCWPGRMELVAPSRPWMLMDGAHNQQGIERLAEALEVFRGDGKGPFVFVAAMLENKEPAILEPLFPLAERFIVTRPSSSRIPPFSPAALAGYIQSRGVPAVSEERVHRAVARGMQADFCVICGSLYLLGEAKAYLQKAFQS